MNLFERRHFDSFVTGLSGTSLVDQWDGRVAKVGGKVFTMLAGEGDHARVIAKCPEESFEILTALGGIHQAPYFAKRKWVEIAVSSPLTQDEAAHYLAQSYRIVAAGLTKKLRQELGIQLSF
jgi:predicted DNA-binding protein (MmcQ/YjbR family)